MPDGTIFAEVWVHPAFGGDDYSVRIDFSGPRPGEDKRDWLTWVMREILKTMSKHRSSRFDDFVLDLRGKRFTMYENAEIKALQENLMKKYKYGKAYLD